MDASRISKTASPSKYFLRGLENLSVPLTDSVIITPVIFFVSKAENHLFSQKIKQESKEVVCLICQPAPAFIQATRGVDRLSSAGSRAAGSVLNLPSLGLEM